MAKWYGVIGYSIQEETVPGVWEDKIIERQYYGDLIRNVNRYQSGIGMNDNVVLTNQLSILSDPFAYENYNTMVYITLNDKKWKITSIEFQLPRILLNIGGVYND